MKQSVMMRKPFQPISINKEVLKHVLQCLIVCNNKKKPRDIAVFLQNKKYDLYDYENENILTPFYAYKEDGPVGCLKYRSAPTMIASNLLASEDKPDMIVKPKLSRNNSDRMEFLYLIKDFVKKFKKSKKTNSVFFPIALISYTKIVVEFLCNFDTLHKTHNNQSHLLLENNDLVLFHVHTNGANLILKKTKNSNVLSLKKKTSFFLKEDLPNIFLESLSKIDVEIESKDPDTKKQIISQKNHLLLSIIETSLAENKSFEEILKFFFDNRAYSFDYFSKTLTTFLRRDNSEKKSLIKSAKDNSKIIKEIIKVCV